MRLFALAVTGPWPSQNTLVLPSNVHLSAAAPGEWMGGQHTNRVWASSCMVHALLRQGVIASKCVFAGKQFLAMHFCGVQRWTTHWINGPQQRLRAEGLAHHTGCVTM